MTTDQKLQYKHNAELGMAILKKSASIAEGKEIAAKATPPLSVTNAKPVQKANNSSNGVMVQMNGHM